MGSILQRLVNGFLSAATVLIMMILVYLGLYRYFMATIFLVFGILTAFVSTVFMRRQVVPSNPFEPPLTSRKRTAYSIMTLLASLILFVVAALLLAGYIA